MADNGGVEVTADGSVYLKGEHALRLENGRVVDVTGKLLRSTITFNGDSKVSTFEITYEGGDDARQLVGIMLALQLAATKLESEPARASEVTP